MDYPGGGMESTERRSITEEYVDPQLADIRQCWDVIKPGILEILSETPSLTFIPEDVYSECVNERAFLFTSPIGFLVLTIEVDRFTKDKTLYMWLAYTYRKGGHQWFAHKNWMNKMAQSFGCKNIEAQSAVPEMESYAVENGWKLDTRVYKRSTNG